jgi:hypothetical protein
MNIPTAFLGPTRLNGRRQTRLAAVALAIFLLAYVVNAAFNSAVIMSSDEYEYLKSAASLIHGSFTIDNRIFELLKARFPDMDGSFSYLLIDPAGKLASNYTVGTALFFAPLLAVFGENLFVITPILCNVSFLILLFCFTFVYFRNRGYRHGAGYALACVVVYTFVIGFPAGIHRDVPGASLVMALSLLVLFATERHKWVLWQTALAVLTFLFTLKFSYALLYVPFFLMLMVSMKGRWRTVPFSLMQLLIGFGISAIFLIPFFLQNSVSSGHWFLPAQHGEASAFLPPAAGPAAWFMTNAHMLISAQLLVYGCRAVKILKIAIAAIFVIFAVAGAWRERSSPVVRCWILPSFVLMHALFFCTAGQRSLTVLNLYLSPTYYCLLFLAICGMRGLLARLSKQGLALAAALVASLLPFLILKTYESLPGHREACFRLSDAKSLASDVETVVPPHGVLLCNKFPSIVIDYFSSVHCFPAYDLWGKNSEAAEKISFLLEKNVPVCYCDYKGFDDDFYRFYGTYLPAHFRTTLVKSNQWMHHFQCATGDSVCNIYRLSLR